MKNVAIIFLLVLGIGLFSSWNTPKVSASIKPQFIDSFSLSNGKKLFQANCSGCHGANGEGAYGPNLCDNYYIHGHHYHAVLHIIKHGVPDKGMTAFRHTLTHEKVRDIAHYVMSLKGSKPTNAKGPEGTKS